MIYPSIDNLIHTAIGMFVITRSLVFAFFFCNSTIWGTNRKKHYHN